MRLLQGNRPSYQNLSEIKKKEMEDKNARNHSAHPTHHVTHVGRRIIRVTDVGKARTSTAQEDPKWWKS